MAPKDVIFNWLCSEHKCCEDDCDGCPSCTYPEDFDGVYEYLSWLVKLKSGKYFNKFRLWLK